MSCILRISGRHLDVDKLIKGSSLKPYDIYKKGQPSYPGLRIKRINKYSGISIEVSKADFDKFEKQIKDAIKFLTKHKTSVKKLTTNKQVESSCLDFGVDLRIGYNNIALQSDTLPYELLKLAGDLKIDIQISLYPPDLESQLEDRLDKEK